MREAYEGEVFIIDAAEFSGLGIAEIEERLQDSDILDVGENEELYVSLDGGRLVVRKLEAV